jgi:hypothetical protein
MELMAGSRDLRESSKELDSGHFTVTLSSMPPHTRTLGKFRRR